MVRASVGIRLLLIESQREANPRATDASCRPGNRLVVALAVLRPARGIAVAGALSSELGLTERR
jgi:hypothetical protein